MIHFPLAILTSSFTIFGALKWIRLLFAAMIVAVLGGRGSDLEQLFGGR